MLRIAVCDDDAYFRDEIHTLLTDYFTQKKYQYEIDQYESGETLLSAAENKPFDLVFMDIEMPNTDGIATGKKLREKQKNIFLIFVTSHNCYYQQAFRLNAFQYLEKPICTYFFVEEMDRVMAEYSVKHQDYIVEYKGCQTKVPLSQIVYLESDYWNVIIHTINGDYKKVGKLNAEESVLQVHFFLRIHQSFLVNMKFIKKFQSEKIVLETGEALSISRKYKDSARKMFINYQHKVGI